VTGRGSHKTLNKKGLEFSYLDRRKEYDKARAVVSGAQRPGERLRPSTGEVENGHKLAKPSAL